MTFNYEIRVRRGDCDPFGHLRTSGYLAYLHESDLAAVEAAGLAAAAGQSWTARQITIEFLQPLLPGEQVGVRAGFYGVRQGLSLRSYEFRRAGEAHSAARLAAGWRLVNAGGKAMELPVDCVQVLQADGEGMPLELEAPPLSKPAPEPLTLRHQVSWGDISVDYQLSYRAWVDLMIEAGLRSGVRYGWTAQQSQEMGAIFVARKLWLEVDEPAWHGEEIEITTWLAEPRRSTIYRQYVARGGGDGAVIARAAILWVYLDLSSGRPARMPEAFMERFRAHVA
jgi:acyl-CoA thioester hydrolase